MNIIRYNKNIILIPNENILSLQVQWASCSSSKSLGTPQLAPNPHSLVGPQSGHFQEKVHCSLGWPWSNFNINNGRLLPNKCAIFKVIENIFNIL